MKHHMTWLSGVAGLSLAVAGGMVACSKPAGPSADLAQDLQAASSNSGSALTLAPNSSGRRDVISSVEQSPEARRAEAASRVQLVSHETLLPPPPAEVPQAVTQPVAPTAVVATVPSAASPAAALPSTSKRPTQMQPAQTGRYKTEAEVFRNAPFPINP
ncbi:MAG: hypothetical protein ABI311_07145 [Gemmatimonadaceae bacterium]